MQTDTENRSNRRIALRRDVQIAARPGWLKRIGRKSRFDGTVENASASGFNLRTESVFPVGTPLRIWITVYVDKVHTRELQLNGDVVWSETEGEGGTGHCGIRLTDRVRGDMGIWVASMLDELRLLNL